MITVFMRYKTILLNIQSNVFNDRLYRQVAKRFRFSKAGILIK